MRYVQTAKVTDVAAENERHECEVTVRCAESGQVLGVVMPANVASGFPAGTIILFSIDWAD